MIPECLRYKSQKTIKKKIYEKFTQEGEKKKSAYYNDNQND